MQCMRSWATGLPPLPPLSNHEETSAGAAAAGQKARAGAESYHGQHIGRLGRQVGQAMSSDEGCLGVYS